MSGVHVNKITTAPITLEVMGWGIYGDMMWHAMSNESPTPKRSESWNLKVDFRILDSSFQLICQVTELRDTKDMEPGCWTRPHISRLFRHRRRRVQISWSVQRFISFAVMTMFLNMLIQVDRSCNLYRGVVSKASWIGWEMFKLPCWFCWDQMRW